jgi:hypothetical protein
MPIRFDGEKFFTQEGAELTTEEAVAWSDTARGRHIDNTPDDDIMTQAARALVLLKKMYAILDCKAEINSFFRCTDLNVVVGGKIHPPSAHMDGRAIDSVPHGKKIEDCFEELKKHVADLDYDQLIIEHDVHGNTWLHSSVAREGIPARHMAFVLEKKDPTNRVVHG